MVSVRGQFLLGNFVTLWERWERHAKFSLEKLEGRRQLGRARCRWAV